MKSTKAHNMALLGSLSSSSKCKNSNFEQLSFVCMIYMSISLLPYHALVIIEVEDIKLERPNYLNGRLCREFSAGGQGFSAKRSTKYKSSVLPRFA